MVKIGFSLRGSLGSVFSLSSTIFSSVDGMGKVGAPGAIRTHDPQIRNLVLYPAELRGQINIYGTIITDNPVSKESFA